MNKENQEIMNFFEKLERFIELANNIHIDSYILENPKNRPKEILEYTYHSLIEEEIEEKKLALEISYSLYRLTNNENYKIVFELRKENRKNDTEWKYINSTFL